MGPWVIKAVNGLLIVASCYLVAGMVTSIGGEALEPPPVQLEVTPSRSDAAVSNVSHAKILERNLFGAQLAGEAQVEPEPAGELDDLEKTKLPLKLLGTAAATNPSLSRASIENQKTRDSHVAFVGYQFEELNRVRVKAIERARVVLDNAGKLEELRLYEEDPNAPRAKPRPAPRQARRRPARPKETLNDRLAKLNGEDGQGISRLLSSARIVPHYDDSGAMQGMKVDAIKPDSLFEQVGLENGDVITEVNGIVVDRLEATSAIFDQLSSAEELNLTWQHQGESRFYQGDPTELAGN